MGKKANPNRTALIVGATGLVGSELLDLLLRSDTYKQVTVLGRKPLKHNHPKLVQHVINFDELDPYEEACAVDDVYCCLGTTIKQAGSQEAFKKVDYEYPLAIAKLAKKKGAKQFALISAIGADPHSRIFYSRVKGEIEESLKELEFPALHIYRPSLLLGKRQDFRLGERIGVITFPVLSLILPAAFNKYKPIQAKDVAYAMYQKTLQDQRGTHIHMWKDMMDHKLL